MSENKQMIMTESPVVSGTWEVQKPNGMEKLGFDVKPEHYGKPAALVKRYDSLFNVYTQEQVYSTKTHPKSQLIRNFPKDGHSAFSVVSIVWE